MPKPDVIITYPDHVDFPLFNKWIKDNRDSFNQVFIGINPSNRENINISNYLFKYLSPLPAEIYISDARGEQDWRTMTVIYALSRSTASRVLFLEQDFIIKNPSMLSTILSYSDPVIGFSEGQDTSRLHPAFLLMDREVIDKTDKNFAPHHPEHDHFGAIYADVKKLGIPIARLEDYNYHSPNDYYHMAGLTHNYSLVSMGLQPVHKVSEFIEYNQQIMLRSDLVICPEFLNVIKQSAMLGI